jgi:predicted cation transporter
MGSEKNKKDVGKSIEEKKKKKENRRKHAIYCNNHVYLFCAPITLLCYFYTYICRFHRQILYKYLLYVMKLLSVAAEVGDLLSIETTTFVNLESSHTSLHQTVGPVTQISIQTLFRGKKKKACFVAISCAFCYHIS